MQYVSAQSFMATVRELSRRGLGIDPRSSLSPDLKESMKSIERFIHDTDGGELTLKEMCSLVLPKNVELINPSWFSYQGEQSKYRDSSKIGLPERVIEVFPTPMRDVIALTVGTVSRVGGLLPEEICREIGRWLWCDLIWMPEPDSSALLDRLVLQTGERLQRLIEKLGIVVFSAFLQHLPQRSSAHLCHRLPAQIAREVWILHRRNSETKERLFWEPNRRALEAGLSDNPTMSLWRMGGYVLCRALDDVPVIVRQMAQRLPRSRGVHLLDFLKKRRHLGAELSGNIAQSLLAAEMRISVERLQGAVQTSHGATSGSPDGSSDGSHDGFFQGS